MSRGKSYPPKIIKQNTTIQQFSKLASLTPFGYFRTFQKQELEDILSPTLADKTVNALVIHIVASGSAVVFINIDRLIHIR